jgi:hypothetical protein
VKKQATPLQERKLESEAVQEIQRLESKEMGWKAELSCGAKL